MAGKGRLLQYGVAFSSSSLSFLPLEAVVCITSSWEPVPTYGDSLLWGCTVKNRHGATSAHLATAHLWEERLGVTSGFGNFC